MRRFNIFQSSHAALRSLLLDTSLLIQFTDFSDAAKVQETFDQVTELVLDCHRQAEEESRYIIPAILRFHKNAPECFSAETYGRNSPANNLLRRMNRIEDAKGSKSRVKSAANMLSAGFRRFAEQVILSMKMQEEMLNPLLWSYYTDEDLQEIQERIEGRQTMAEWLSLCTWMVKDMDDEEIADWLLSVRSTLPYPVFEQLVDRLSAGLPLLRWNKVQSGLTEEAMVA